MNIIIKKDHFDVSKIIITNKKFSTKLLYKVNNISILGIPLLINDHECVIDGFYVYIKLLDVNDILLFKKIDRFFYQKIRTGHLMNQSNIIKIKNNHNYSIKDIQDKEIKITISTIKNINHFNKIYLYFI